MGIAADLDAALKNAGIPIFGVSIGRKDDRSTWRADFTADATPEQREQAEEVIAAFIVAQP